MKSKLIEVLSIQSKSYNQYRMFAYIIRQLKKLGCTYYVYNGCIYATKGEAEFYPCIASHMDTVHEIVEDLTVIETNGNLTGINSFTMQQTGIGGDDKVGIYIALQCISKFHAIKTVFFRDEEVGCEGSYDCDYSFFNDCGFVLQCDRRGYGDFITNASGTKLSGEDFQKDIAPLLKSYGYKFNNGMMTDVMALKENGIECSMANISCGYYNPHCSNEYVNVKEVKLCLEMVIDIISLLDGRYYVCKYKAPKRYKYPTKDTNSIKDILHDRYGFWPDDEKLKEKEKEVCECCNEGAKLTFVSDFNIEMCDKCIKEYIQPYNV